MKRLNIGYIGNFAPQYSTENDRIWSFNKLGHNTFAFQENITTPIVLMDYLDKLDMLVYSHTHDPAYNIPMLKEVFKKYKERGVPTVSVHLDRWAWLDRVKDVGQEATWFTEHIFMADASPEAIALYKKYKLNWHYLEAAVVERDCYMAQPDEVMFPHEIVFVGSKGYHPEYPFRAKLIDFLQENYGNRFGHYGNDGLGVVRGHALNMLYSTAKIVVGDSCFGGRPSYVSDRYYETRGRGGFLLHPKIEGVDHNGVGFYGGFTHDDKNLADLKDRIEYWLNNPELREVKRAYGFAHVKENETYTNRAQQIIDTLGL